MVSKLKRPPTEWEKISANHVRHNEGTDNQNIQGTHKTKLPQNQRTNKEIGN
jgi:hypothetical protein